MRLGFLVMAFMVEVRGDLGSAESRLLLPPDVAREVDALNKEDYAGYARIHGMNLTILKAVTSDGWVLQVWRVRSMGIYDAELSTPVILAHGFGSSSFDYMTNLRNQSTAFVLADNGYDVFCINFRGNQFSNRIRLNGTTREPESEEYYKATWQYMADYDLPAVFEKVQTETGQSKLYLIGHSMGGTASFAYLSGNRSYDDKILHFAAVVPVLKFGEDLTPSEEIKKILVPGLTHAIQVTTPIIDIPFKLLFKSVFGTQLLASTGDSSNRLTSMMQSFSWCISSDFCNHLLYAVGGRDPVAGTRKNPHLNYTRTAIYFNKFPGGTTLMNSYNFEMEGKKDPWTKIDFRKIPLTGLTNEGEYNSTEPPKYDFPALKVPFSLYYMENDGFTGVKTAKAVITELNATDYKIMNADEMTHSDSVVGIDTRCYTINDIMSKFQALENKRDDNHRNYRRRVSNFVKSLPFEDGCPSVTESSDAE